MLFGSPGASNRFSTLLFSITDESLFPNAHFTLFMNRFTTSIFPVFPMAENGADGEKSGDADGCPVE